MKEVVQDVSIIFDLLACDIFEEFFGLDLEVYTTSLVFAEILKPDQKRVCDLAVLDEKLRVVAINTLEYLKLQAMEASGLSVQDRSVLKLAKERNAILLTGDGKLRRTACSQAIEVHGILWIFDAIVKHLLLSPPEAVARLRLLKESNARLPFDEIDKRIKEWS